MAIHVFQHIRFGTIVSYGDLTVLLEDQRWALQQLKFDYKITCVKNIYDSTRYVMFISDTNKFASELI